MPCLKSYQWSISHPLLQARREKQQALGNILTGLYEMFSGERARILNTFIHLFKKQTFLLKNLCKIIDE